VDKEFFMTKKKRSRKLTVFGSVEGNREEAFIEFLREIYQPQNNNISFIIENANGGGADSIVLPALHKCDRNRSFAWLDEDFEPKHSPLSEAVRQKLIKCWCVPSDKHAEFISCSIGNLQKEFNKENKNPILIVSQPVCSESLILRNYSGI
jgi:GT2 family glycosyltransferase